MHPLAADLRRDLDALRNEAAMLDAALARFGPATTSDDATLRWLALGGLASGIEQVHSGMEGVLRRMAAEIDGHVPRDETWHATLPRRMAAPLPGVRDAVLAPETLARLDGLRAFRHRERNSYAGDLDAGRVREIGAGIAATKQAFVHDVGRLIAELDAPVLRPAADPG